MRVIGIDPGLAGAVAILEDGKIADVADMPVFKLAKGGRSRGVVDVQGLLRLLQNQDDAVAIIEEAQAMPKQGVASAFNYGATFGATLAAVASCAIPYTLVRPSVWKKALDVPADKDGARAAASRLLPSGAALWPRKKDDGRAEAALLAFYGWMKT